MNYFIITFENGATAEFVDTRYVPETIHNYLLDEGVDSGDAEDAACWCEDAMLGCEFEGDGYTIEVVYR